jgi:Na+-transporting methylmalonyl-CoA/oxaloacetate decarboxylase gamma subunit
MIEAIYKQEGMESVALRLISKLAGEFLKKNKKQKTKKKKKKTKQKKDIREKQHKW